MRALVLALVLTGCHAEARVHAGFASALGLSILAIGAYDYEGARDEAPYLAPDRKVSEQDCTKPIDHTLGNLRCK